MLPPADVTEPTARCAVTVPTAPVTVTESGVAVHPDGARVIHQFFVPGRDDVGPGDSRASPVIDRLLRLDEHEVEAAMRDVEVRFSHRHRDLDRVFFEHASRVRSRIGPDVVLSTARQLLLGAAFTAEYAIEGAALCNPSAVLHPRQDFKGGARPARR